MARDDSPLRIPATYIRVLIILVVIIPTLYFAADILLSQVTKLDVFGYQITSNISAEGEQYYSKAMQQQQAMAAQGSTTLDIVIFVLALFFIVLFILALVTAIRRQES